MVIPRSPFDFAHTQRGSVQHSVSWRCVCFPITATLMQQTCTVQLAHGPQHLVPEAAHQSITLGLTSLTTLTRQAGGCAWTDQESTYTQPSERHLGSRRQATSSKFHKSGAIVKCLCWSVAVFRCTWHKRPARAGVLSQRTIGNNGARCWRHLDRRLRARRRQQRTSPPLWSRITGD